MARTVNADAAVTRQRILDAATARFASDGRAGVSIRVIANDAGVNSALISHYFGSKCGLYDACLHQVYDALGDWEAVLLKDLSLEGGVKAWLAQVVPTALHFVRRHHSSLRLVTREVLSQGTLGLARREGVLVPFLAKAVAYIQPQTRHGESEVRFALQSLVFLVVRYGLASQDDLAAVNGCALDVEENLTNHLVKIAQNLLCNEA